ncbi:mitogen-activated protein kinase kinase kinase 1-like [Pollicipes pollicipes]|uniref:mitogen-activated protein kinase kinase kinase 1-like n=1 Tax=Pollicipes pollicipes TaxID=41117 RepID=UPI0018854553|nr:mitogen-activated protein kinase kinase kinase 1-like [Pollicipes pollicipes]
MVSSPGGRSAVDLLHHLADLLAVLCADPVYKVFDGAIVSGLRRRGSGLPDPAPVPGRLRLAVEEEVCDHSSLVLDRLMQECLSGADSWQWCLGRLRVADVLVGQFRAEFSGAGGDAADRVTRLAEFAHHALTHPHATVGRLARSVFVQMATGETPVSHFGDTSSVRSAMDLGGVQDVPVPRPPRGPVTTSVKDCIVCLHDPDLEGDTSATYTEGEDWARGALLGTGGFARCYQACDLRSGRLVAVKQVEMSPQTDKAALLREMRLLANVQHPHVLRLLCATRRPGVVNLFTDWQAGGSVADLLKMYGPFADDVTHRYSRHLVDGLAYLHDNGILHRDLKGANLLVDSTGETLKIGDLGTAAELGAAATLRGEFTGQVRGTLAFTAPEVLRGEHYGRSCDVWSVGCCVIEMATGQPPWQAYTRSNHLAMLFMIAGSPTPPEMPCHLPDDLRTLISDCHQMDPEKRPAARQLLDYPCFKGISTNV